MQEGFGYGRPKALEIHEAKSVGEYFLEEVPFYKGKKNARLLETFPYYERPITQPSVYIPKGFGDIGLFDIKTIKLREQFQRKVAGGTVGARAKDITDVSTMMGNVIKDFEKIGAEGFETTRSISILKKQKKRFEQPELFVKDVSLPDFKFTDIFKESFFGKAPKASEKFVDIGEELGFQDVYGRYKPSKVSSYSILTTPRAGAYSLLDTGTGKQYQIIREDYNIFDYKTQPYKSSSYKVPSYKTPSYKTPNLYKIDLGYKMDMPYKFDVQYKQDIPYKVDIDIPYTPPPEPRDDIPYKPTTPPPPPPEIPGFPPPPPGKREDDFPDFFDLEEEIKPKREKLKPISRKYTYAPDLGGIFFGKSLKKEPRGSKIFSGFEQRSATEKELSISPFKQLNYNIFKEAKAEFGFPKATARQEREGKKRKSFIQRLGKGIIDLDLGRL